MALLVLGLSLGVGLRADPIIPYFRYYDANHQVHVEAHLSEDALNFGYEELDKNLNVVRKVPPRLAGRELERVMEDRRRQAEAVEQAKQDALLHQLYASPKDAERERDRQLE